MADTRNEKNRRREFLRDAVRYPILIALGLVAGRLLARRASGPLHPDETCMNRGLCRDCRRMAGCPLPQAVMLRQAQRRP